jgi:hypothetical protein
VARPFLLLGALPRGSQLDACVQDSFSVVTEAFLASEALDAVFESAPSDRSEFRDLVLALVRASPLVQEAWGTLYPSPRPVRVELVREALTKEFKGGTRVPSGVSSDGLLVPSSDLVALPSVSRVTSDSSIVLEAVETLPFFVSGEALREEVVEGATPPPLSPTVCLLAPPTLLMRRIVERLLCLSELHSESPASFLAKHFREVAQQTEHGCFPASLICAAPDLKALKATAESLAASLKSFTAVLGSESVLFRPSRLLAPVYLGESFTKETEIGLVLVARCDSHGRVLSAVQPPDATSLDRAFMLAASAETAASPADDGEALVQRLANALSFHLSTARMRYTQSLCAAAERQENKLSLRQLAALPRVRQQLAGRLEHPELALLLKTAALRTVYLREPAPIAVTAAAEPASHEPSLDEELCLTHTLPEHRRWVIAYGVKSAKAEPGTLASAQEEEAAEGPEQSATDDGLSKPDVPMMRVVSNVGEDDSSFVAFSRHGDEEAEPVVEPEEDETHGWESSLLVDAVRAALERGESTGRRRGDEVVARAMDFWVAALASATGGGTPFQTEEDALAGRFSVMSFNILADAYLVAEDFPWTGPLTRDWGWRRSMIVAEVLFRRPSILCMQEVESWTPPPPEYVTIPSGPASSEPPPSVAAASSAVASSSKWQSHAADKTEARRWGGPHDNKYAWFEETFARHGYRGFYARKIKSSGRPMPGHSIGNALFWRDEEFECKETFALSLADEAMSVFPAGSVVWERGFPQVVAMAHLRHRATGNELLAASVHLSSDYSQPHIQACQAIALRTLLKRYSASLSVKAVVVSGDYNCTPTGAVYLAMKTARMSAKNAHAARESGAGEVPTPFVVDSARASQGPERVPPALQAFETASHWVMGTEPPFTVFCTAFAAPLDYVFFDKSALVAEATLDGLPRRALQKEGGQGDELSVVSADGHATGSVESGVGLPTLEFPSDHLPVAAVLRFVTAAEAKQAARQAQVGHKRFAKGHK